MHTEILTEAQIQVLQQIAQALEGTEYYLAGGTALALQIGHRPSVDLDWFIPQLGEPERLLHRFTSSRFDFTVLSVSPETVYLLMNKVQVSFIGYPYPLLQSKVVWPQTGIQMAGMDDIACMKLSAVASRGSRKDFIDLYCLVTHFRPLKDYLQLYQQKYQQRDIGHVVRSLVYFADADAEPDIRMRQSVGWEEIKSSFEHWISRLRP